REQSGRDDPAGTARETVQAVLCAELCGGLPCPGSRQRRARTRHRQDDRRGPWRIDPHRQRERTDERPRGNSRPQNGGMTMKLGTRLTRWLLPCAAAALLASALSGCAGGSRTELVVIPDAGEPPASATGGQPFRVKTIYRLPVSESDVVRPLGWSDPDTVIALTANLM